MKRIIFLSLILIIFILISGIFFAFIKVDYEKLNFIQRNIASSIYEKWEEHVQNTDPEKRALIDYHLLLNKLNVYEKLFALRIFDIEPKEIDFMGPFYSIEKPDSLIRIESIKLFFNENEIETGIQYYPLHFYKDYVAMMEAMQREIGKKLFIDSGYRSPGRQAYLFFKYLVNNNDFSLKENGRWIAMPGYSEHGSPFNTAIDFINENGINGFSNNQTAADFENLEEYKWLDENASRFNFYLSYPRNNNFGVAFEPWHWHWENRPN